MRASIGLTIAALLTSAATALAAKPHYEISGKVVKIADGDRLTILDADKTRLAGIDAPENGQPFGTRARENLAGKVFGEAVRIEVIDRDRYAFSALFVRRFVEATGWFPRVSLARPVPQTISKLTQYPQTTKPALRASKRASPPQIYSGKASVQGAITH
jgi:Staphylococcal nuclease homologue